MSNKKDRVRLSPEEIEKKALEAAEAGFKGLVEIPPPKSVKKMGDK